MSVPEVGSLSLFDRRLTIFWSAGSTSVCELVGNVSQSPGGSLQNQVSKWLVAG